MKILNLHAGIGGNRKLWGDEHKVTAVEYNKELADIYKRFYPNDEVIIADAGEYLAKNYEKFDFIWASPSCVTHSRIRMMASKSKRNRKYDAKMPNMELYSFIVFLNSFFEGKWVVENVKPYYPPLINPNGVIGRHLVWCNFDFKEKKFDEPTVKHCKVTGKTERFGISLQGIKMKQRKDQIIRNCVNPEIGLYLLKCSFPEQPAPTGITITDVKVVGLCSKCRKEGDDIPKNKDGSIVSDEKISCINKAFRKCNSQDDNELNLDGGKTK